MTEELRFKRLLGSAAPSLLPRRMRKYDEETDPRLHDLPTQSSALRINPEAHGHSRDGCLDNPALVTVD